ncbi:hypothetical protein FACS1894188_06380 [Clostridia bacterium]|nr:hypothetical protein FACS1894188_06380 [Clostridia bacterium]
MEDLTDEYIVNSRNEIHDKYKDRIVEILPSILGAFELAREEVLCDIEMLKPAD